MPAKLKKLSPTLMTMVLKDDDSAHCDDDNWIANGADLIAHCDDDNEMTNEAGGSAQPNEQTQPSNNFEGRQIQR